MIVDVGSDHNLFVARMTLNLRNAKIGMPRSQRPDIEKAEGHTHQGVAQHHAQESLQHPRGESALTIDDLNTALMESVKETIGCTKIHGSEWIPPDTWRTIEEKKQLKKQKILDSKSPSLKERAVAQYRAKDKQIRTSARRDKRRYMERLATEAEAAAERKDMKTVYRITRKLCGDGGQSQDLTVKAKDGSTITEEKATLERSGEHSQQLINRFDPPKMADKGETEQELGIVLGPISVQEVKDAINKLKNGDAPGGNNVCAETL